MTATPPPTSVQMPAKYTADTVLPRRQLFIGGRSVPGTSGEVFETIHPGHNRVVAEVDQASQTDVDAAVAAARAAYPIWSRMPAVERGDILRRAAALVRARNDELAALETLTRANPSRKPARSTSSPALRCWSITPMWPKRCTAIMWTCRPTPLPCCAVSRSASSGPSARGTIPSRLLCGSLAPGSPAATQWCSSRLS